MAASNSELEDALNVAFVAALAIIVFFMQAGFAFLEAGSVRSKNTSSILLKNMVDAAIGVISFWGTGYAFGFGGSNPFIGYRYFFLAGLPDDLFIDFFLQYVFASTAVTIISGALAERTNIWAYVTFSFLVLGIVYPTSAHWVWGEGGWLDDLNYVDHAGSSVVHALGGVGALVGAAIVGARLGRFEGGQVLSVPGHSTVLATLGFLILWFGFYAFNAVSDGGIVGDGFSTNEIGRSITNTAISCACGMLSAMIILKASLVKQEVEVFGKELRIWNVFGGFWSLGGAINGGLSGCVAICGGCNVYDPWAAAVVGLCAGVFYTAAARAILIINIDDPLNASPVHLVAGVWGVIAVGLLAPAGGLPASPNGGILYAWDGDSFIQMGIQLLGVFSITLWGALWSTVLLGIMRLLGVLRVSAIAEEDGLDYNDGEPAYPLDPALAGTKSSFLDSDTLSQSDLPDPSAY